MICRTRSKERTSDGSRKERVEDGKTSRNRNNDSVRSVSRIWPHEITIGIYFQRIQSEEKIINGAEALWLNKQIKIAFN